MSIVRHGAQGHPLAIEAWCSIAMLALTQIQSLPFISQQDLSERYTLTSEKLLFYTNEYSEQIELLNPSLFALRCPDSCELPPVPEFVEIADSVIANGPSFSSPEFASLTESLRVELETDFTLCHDALARGSVIATTITVISAVCLIIAFGIDRFFHIRFRALLRTAIVLLRHLPPAVIAPSHNRVRRRQPAFGTARDRAVYTAHCLSKRWDMELNRFLF
jgi:hypothetical protein